MKDWEYSFKPISKAEWFRQIEKDINPKSIESLQDEWWPGEHIIPFHHGEDRKATVALPDHYFSKAPQLIEWIITTQDQKEMLHRASTSIAQGATHIVFDSFSSSIKEILKGALPGTFQIVTQADFYPDDVPQQVIRRISRGDLSAQAFFERIQAIPQYRVTYEMPLKGNWIENITPRWGLLRKDLEYLREKDLHVDFIKNIILVIQPDSSFLRQIIQTRVLQLLWLNEIQFMEDYQERMSPMELHIHPSQNEAPDQYLIRASTIALAGSLSGIDALCIHHLDDARISEHYRRNSLNISHLLSLESEMYKGIDPLAGSYAIDHYTLQWSKTILEGLK